MKKLIFIFFFSIITNQLFSQNIDTLKISQRLTQMEIENSVLKAKLEAYNDNNSNILNTVSITIAILLGIFGLVNITQLIQNYKMNTKKLLEIEKRILAKLNNEIETKIQAKNSEKSLIIQQIKRDILNLEILTLQNKCPSTDTQNINFEIMNLVKLLELSLKYFDNYKHDYYIDTALKGFILHLERHSIAEYEKEKIYNAMKDLSSEFEFKRNKIITLLKDK